MDTHTKIAGRLQLTIGVLCLLAEVAFVAVVLMFDAANISGSSYSKPSGPTEILTSMFGVGALVLAALLVFQIQAAWAYLKGSKRAVKHLAVFAVLQLMTAYLLPFGAYTLWVLFRKPAAGHG